MSNLKVSDKELIGDFDHAISSVRDTHSHDVFYGECGSDGSDVGVLYDDIECAVIEVAEKWQLAHDNHNTKVVKGSAIAKEMARKFRRESDEGGCR